jgi:hypothetical protein
VSSNDKYSVGYRKPPQQMQFAKGRSGNPKGRPKGSKNFATAIQNELDARVDITENGKRKKSTKREAAAKQLVNRAAAGDGKAILVLLNETRAHENRLVDATQSEQFDPVDQMVIGNIIDRIVQTHKLPHEQTATEEPPVSTEDSEAEPKS